MIPVAGSKRLLESDGFVSVLPRNLGAQVRNEFLGQGNIKTRIGVSSMRTDERI